MRCNSDERRDDSCKQGELHRLTLDVCNELIGDRERNFDGVYALIATTADADEAWQLMMSRRIRGRCFVLTATRNNASDCRQAVRGVRTR